jgi:hypothetical protein
VGPFRISHRLTSVVIVGYRRGTLEPVMFNQNAMFTLEAPVWFWGLLGGGAGGFGALVAMCLYAALYGHNGQNG